MPIQLSDINNLIVQYVPQFFADGTARGQYARRLIRKSGLTRTDGSQWKFIDTAATAVRTSELDPLPSASNYTQQDAILKSAYVRSVIKISDETLDSINRGGLILDNYLEDQIAQSIASIEAQVESLTVGGTDGNFVGLGAWALDTGSPAGISRSTYSNWQAYTNDNSGTPRAMTVTLLRDVMDTLLKTKQGRCTAIFMSVDKATTLGGLTGVGLPTRSFDVGQAMGNVANMGFGDARDVLLPVHMFDNVPVYRIPSMGNDKVWFLDLDQIRYEQADAPIVSEAVRKDDGSYQWDIRLPVNLVVPNPAKNCAALIDLS